MIFEKWSNLTRKSECAGINFSSGMQSIFNNFGQWHSKDLIENGKPSSKTTGPSAKWLWPVLFSPLKALKAQPAFTTIILSIVFFAVLFIDSKCPFGIIRGDAGAHLRSSWHTNVFLCNTLPVSHQLNHQSRKPINCQGAPPTWSSTQDSRSSIHAKLSQVRSSQDCYQNQPSMSKEWPCRQRIWRNI